MQIFILKTEFHRNGQHMKIFPEEVDQFAQKVGYEYAEYRIEWKGYSCYELCFTGMDDMKIGWPQYVLVDRKGKMRLAKDEKREMK